MTNTSVDPSAEVAPERRSWVGRLGIPRPLAWGFVGVLVFMVGDGVEIGYLAPYLTGEGFSPQRVALIFTAYGVSAGVAAWCSGALSELWGPRRVMWLGLAIWVVFHVLFLAVAIPSMSFPLMVASYCLRGFGYPLFAYGFLVWVAAATPQHRLGTAVGWFWFAFTGGLPTLGSLVASVSVPWLGSYATFWLALGLVVIGGLIALLLVRDPTGSQRLAPVGERPLATLLGSVTILWRVPKIGVGAVVRTINTAPQFGFFVFLPAFFTETIGFSLPEWLRLLTVMFATNIFFNLFFGVVGDKVGWRRTVALFGGVGSAATTMLLFYVPDAFGDSYPLALVVVALYGATLAGYVPLSALMPSLAPEHKGQAMAALNLGAGASVMVGPAIVGLLLGPIGVEGVMWVFAALYLASAVMAMLLRLPGGAEDRPGPGRARDEHKLGQLASMAGGSLLGHPLSLRTPVDDDPVELVLFDIGGTLYDDDCFAQALLAAARDLAGDVDETEFWAVYDAQREHAGGSLRTALAERYAGGDRAALVDRARAHWHYPANALYSDVPPALVALSERYRLGIVANSQANVLAALDRDGVRNLLDVVALADQVGAEKPDLRIFQHALDEAGVDASRVVYVGNRLDTDIRPAKALGMRTVWMLRGEASPAPTREQLAEPDAVITSLAGLPAVLDRFAHMTDRAGRR